MPRKMVSVYLSHASHPSPLIILMLLHQTLPDQAWYKTIQPVPGPMKRSNPNRMIQSSLAMNRRKYSYQDEIR